MSREVPVEHLDFEYVRGCRSGSEVEDILRVLRSGKEGHYPELMHVTEERLRELKPKSKLLKRASKAPRHSDLPKQDQELLSSDLKDWESNISKQEVQVAASHRDEKSDDLPPVRSGNVSVKKEKGTDKKTSSKSAAPRSYGDWDKYDADKDIAAMKTEKEKLPPKPRILPSPLTKKELKCSQSEKVRRAESERSKGNEAYKVADYQEALAYYSRCIQLQPSSAVAYNNRAVTALNLELYKEAIQDCDKVLRLDSKNSKALMRRAMGRHKLGQLSEAREDLQQLLRQQPDHKAATKLLQELEKELGKTDPIAPTATKKRIKIEEIETAKDTAPPPTSHDPGSHETKSHEKKSHDLGSLKTKSHNAASCDPGSHETKSHDKNIPVSEHHPAKPIQQPPLLPAKVMSLKDKGNGLFKSGQYGEALDHYSRAIQTVQSEYPNNTADLAVLLSNRAACHLKIGDCRGCVTDTSAAIAMAPAKSCKPLLRRALAYETMEKYKLAYVDYQLVLRLDGSAEQASTACSRLAKVLSNDLGSNWRSKLTTPHDHMAVITSCQVAKKSGDAAVTSPQLAAEPQQFETIKDKGNSLVKKGKFAEALACYSECIELFPSNPIPYINRALCHLKLNAPTAAADDCTKTLQLSPDNVKALYRRAVAMKECGQLAVAMDDLNALLKIEPNNQTAQKELAVVTARSRQQGKKRVPIVVEKEETTDVPSKGTPPTSVATVSPVVSPPTRDIVLGDKVTPYQFVQSWNSIPRSSGSRPYASLLRQVSPQQLPTLLTNKLDGDMLGAIILAVKEHLLTKDEVRLAASVMLEVAKVDRFTIIVKFLSSKQKTVVQDILKCMEDYSSVVMATELTELRKLYSA